MSSRSSRRPNQEHPVIGGGGGGGGGGGLCPTYYSFRLTTQNPHLKHMRPKRGSLHFVSEAVNFDLVQKWEKTFISMTDRSIKEFRKQQATAFPNAIIDVNQYRPVVQGNIPACSFVGTLNGLRIARHVHTEDPNPFWTDVATGVVKNDVFKKWLKYWKTMTGLLATPAGRGNWKHVSAADIGDVLDAMIQAGVPSNPAVMCRSLTYVPIRSRDAGENAFNTEFWLVNSTGHPHPKILNRYSVDESDYVKEPFLYQIAYFIESKLDQKHPVVINCQEHTRTAVGYNDTHILFADNYAEDSDLEIYKKASSGHSTFGASLSTTDKWFVYSWVRDLLIWH
jgi:hypothetical protein